MIGFAKRFLLLNALSQQKSRPTIFGATHWRQYTRVILVLVAA